MKPCCYLRDFKGFNEPGKVCWCEVKGSNTLGWFVRGEPSCYTNWRNCFSYRCRSHRDKLKHKAKKVVDRVY